MKNIYIIVTILLLYNLGCSTSKRQNNACTNDLISNEGTYFFDSLDIWLEIHRTEQELFYILRDTKDTLISSCELIPGIFNWAIVFSLDGSLWIYNSDAGYNVWIKDSIEEYKNYELLQDRSLLEIMPSTLKKDLHVEFYEKMYKAIEEYQKANQ